MSDIKPDELPKNLNKAIFNVLRDENMLLGHAYFIPTWTIKDEKIVWTIDDLKMMFNYYIIPIIEGYTRGNARFLNSILGSSLAKRIDDTDETVIEVTQSSESVDENEMTVQLD